MVALQIGWINRSYVLLHLNKNTSLFSSPNLNKVKQYFSTFFDACVPILMLNKKSKLFWKVIYRRFIMTFFNLEGVYTYVSEVKFTPAWNFLATWIFFSFTCKIHDGVKWFLFHSGVGCNSCRAPPENWHMSLQVPVWKSQKWCSIVKKLFF